MDYPSTVANPFWSPWDIELVPRPKRNTRRKKLFRDVSVQPCRHVSDVTCFVVAAFHFFCFRFVSAGVTDVRSLYIRVTCYTYIVVGCKATYGELIYNVRAWSVQYLTDFGRCIGEVNIAPGCRNSQEMQRLPTIINQRLEQEPMAIAGRAPLDS